jgi:hypothetical protein
MRDTVSPTGLKAAAFGSGGQAFIRALPHGIYLAGEGDLECNCGRRLGVIVVEVAEWSGALITVRHAMEQGREVFAVPGRVNTRTALGRYQLIRDRAELVDVADDVLEELEPLVEAAPRDDGQITHHPAELMLNDFEQ